MEGFSLILDPLHRQESEYQIPNENPEEKRGEKLQQSIKHSLQYLNIFKQCKVLPSRCPNVLYSHFLSLTGSADKKQVVSSPCFWYDSAPYWYKVLSDFKQTDLYQNL